MIRYLYSTSILVCCLGLPLKAEDKDTRISSQLREKGAKTALSTKNRFSTSIASASDSRNKDNKKPKTAHSRLGEGQRLARLTAYWAGEGDYYTSHDLSSTGIHLHDGHCAVDPRIIPYGSEVSIAGLGTYLAVDTGSAVISREAAKETGRTSEERNALVIDLYFDSRRDGERFAANGPKFAAISWHSPDSTENVLRKPRSFASNDSN